MTQALKYAKKVSKPGTATVSKSVPSSVLLAWLNIVMEAVALEPSFKFNFHFYKIFNEVELLI